MSDSTPTQIRLDHYPTGIPADDAWTVTHDPTPELAEGQIEVDVQLISIDPWDEGMDHTDAELHAADRARRCDAVVQHRPCHAHRQRPIRRGRRRHRVPRRADHGRRRRSSGAAAATSRSPRWNCTSACSA